MSKPTSLLATITNYRSQVDDQLLARLLDRVAERLNNLDDADDYPPQADEDIRRWRIVTGPYEQRVLDVLETAIRPLKALEIAMVLDLSMRRPLTTEQVQCVLFVLHDRGVALPVKIKIGGETVQGWISPVE